MSLDEFSIRMMTTKNRHILAIQGSSGILIYLVYCGESPRVLIEPVRLLRGNIACSNTW
jgi:hypothetical protein